MSEHPAVDGWQAARESFEAGRSLQECAALVSAVTSKSTVRRRALREGWRRPADMEAPRTAAATAAAAVVASSRWLQRRVDEADAAGEAAVTARKRVLELLKGSDAAMLRATVIAYGVLVDKAQLLSGEATSRLDVPNLTPEQRRERVEHLADELAKRRALTLMPSASRDVGPDSEA